VVPLLVRTVFPRFSYFFYNSYVDSLLKESTEIGYFRDDNHDEQGTLSELYGYTVEEMCDRVANLFKSIGLVKNFSRIILVIGHGSSSKNNPYKSAYDCGACGGRPGRINARVFALMANDPKVRVLLLDKYSLNLGEAIVVGAYHDTTNDNVVYFDTKKIPHDYTQDFNELKSNVLIARARNADERCRRFAFYAHKHSAEQSLNHVEARSSSIAEPRPEYGHATNAICLIGRREISKGLFLDRRAFLVSYDPLQDHDMSILVSILRAVIPVCAGINLEYYFSALDNEKYGAGNKLPANVTAKIGVITGFASDLRTGLPQQMIEIHEPVRLITVVEAKHEKLLSAIDQLPYVKKLITNNWLTVASFDTELNEITMANKDVDRKINLGNINSGLSEVWGEEILIKNSSDNLPFTKIH
jgi:uncharacterized protein